MGLTSSLYSGVSGLNNMSTAMQVIGDNVSNVNTTGFKGARATFQDIMAQSVSTARGGSQIGRGSSMSDVTSVYSQGSFEAEVASLW
jgi:flagellar hook protein FlgE